MCKGGSSATTSQTSGPPPQVLQNYQNVYNTAAGLAGTPLSNPSSVVAPFSSNQEWALNNASYPAQMWGNYANAAQQDFQPGSAQAFMSPYIQDVVNATQAQFANQNAQQQQGVIGNAIASNAWGGDRAGVAQGITAGQQQLAEAPVIANLYNQGYQQAQNAAQSAGWGLAGLGAQAGNIFQGQLQNALTLGGLQQGREQALMNAPFQATNWLANIGMGTGSLSGGTGTTTYPGPSPVSQGIGLGAAGVGLLGATGAFGESGWLGNLFSGGGGGDWSSGNRGGAVVHRAAGGIAPGFAGKETPFGGDESPFGLGVPVSIAPAPITHPGFTANAPQVTSTMTPGSGGVAGDIASGLGLAAKIAPFFLDRGGGIRGYDDGGDILREAPDFNVHSIGGGDAGDTGNAVAPGIAPYTPNPWMALAAAGFGAAGGSSPFAMQNIGRGGLEGLQYYEKQREIAPEIAIRQAELAKLPSQIRLSEAQAQQAETTAALQKAAIAYNQGQGGTPGTLDDIMGNLSDIKATPATPGGVGAAPPANLVAPNLGKGVDWKDENPEFQKRVSAMLAAMPPEIKQAAIVASGYRTPQEQADIYERSDHGAKFAAAPPGQSEHNKGLAADWQFTSPSADQWVHQNAANYGLAFPLGSRDPNHMQLAQAAGAPSPVKSIPTAAGNIAVPANMGSDPNYQVLDREYASILHSLNNPMIWMNPNAQAQQHANLVRLYEQDGRMAGLRAGAVAAAEVGPHLQQKAGEANIDIAAAGPKEAAKTGAESGTYVLPGGGEGIAPKSQIMSGAAPGMGGTQGREEPVTAGGKFDPSPQSLVGPRPGVPMTKLSTADTDKLADDTKTYREYKTTAENAPQTVQRTQELGQILQRLNTGKVLEAGQELSQWARALGLESLIRPGYDPSDAEKVNKLATSLVFEQLKAAGGRPMVTEIAGLQQANPDIAKTPQANLDIIGNIEAQARYTQDRFIQASKVYNQYHQLGNFDEKYLANSPLGKIFDDTKKQLGVGQTPASQILSEFPNAKKAADGRWGVIQNGKWHPIIEHP